MAGHPGRQPSQCLVPPGGKMAVYTGMINFVTSDDQLAAVMGHEIAHAVARHGTERLSQTQAAQVVLAATDGELNDREMRIAESAFGLGVALPFSRAHEHEADELGISIAAAAGYEPKAAIDLWRAMEQETGRTPNFYQPTPVQAPAPNSPPCSRPRNASETATNDLDRPTY